MNGVTFALSAVILVRLPLDRPRPAEADGVAARQSLFREGLAGWREVAGLVDVRIVILASTGAMFLGGVFNVAEPLFATQTLDSGQAGYSVLVGSYGIGFILGSLTGSKGGAASLLRRRYVQGLAVTAVGSLCTALAPSVAIALGTFLLAGFGNGLLVVHERLLIQTRVADSMFGRAFGLADTLASWALAVSFLLAGVIAAWIDPRGLILIVGGGELLLATVAAVALRSRVSFGEAQVQPASSR